jgi:ribosomal protein L40E
MEPTKTCPECGSEYTARAQSCADCHVALVWRRERPRPIRAGQGDPWAALPDGPAGLLIEDDQHAIDYYVDLLADAGIPSAVLPVLRSRFDGGLEPVPDGSGVGFRTQLFAARADYETADLMVRDGFARRNPALAETPYLEFPSEGCPACGASLPEDAAACPDCGLEFPAEES